LSARPGRMSGIQWRSAATLAIIGPLVFAMGLAMGLKSAAGVEATCIGVAGWALGALHLWTTPRPFFEDVPRSNARSYIPPWFPVGEVILVAISIVAVSLLGSVHSAGAHRLLKQAAVVAAFAAIGPFYWALWLEFRSNRGGRTKDAM
jgi:hypothetical protein